MAAAWSRADVLVSDLELAVRNGDELIRNVRRAQADTDLPALALRAGAGADDRRQAVAAGFNALTEKPLTREGIVTSVLDLIQHAARR
jgi:CheY-like chemotaxis protein